MKPRSLCLATLGFVSLAGCAHPIVTSCITKEQLSELERQEPPRVKDKLHGKADEDIRPIAGSNLLLREYSHTLLGVLKVCAS